LHQSPATGTTSGSQSPFSDRVLLAALLAAAGFASGCASPYHSDRGALFGGLVGAGTGAIVGNQLGSTGAGTAIGAGLGALSGAAIGQGMDDIEARNAARVARIEQQMGRQLAAGAATIADVKAMSAAGVDDQLIINHIRAAGVATRPSASDVIALQQQGVSAEVISALQTTQPPQPTLSASGGGPAIHQPPVIIEQPATPVIVEHYRYGPPCWGPPRHHWRRFHHHRYRPGVTWGLSFSSD
jgi:hypothetical protein